LAFIIIIIIIKNKNDTVDMCRQRVLVAKRWIMDEERQKKTRHRRSIML
jgi:hypothetical protein